MVNGEIFGIFRKKTNGEIVFWSTVSLLGNFLVNFWAGKLKKISTFEIFKNILNLKCYILEFLKLFLQSSIFKVTLR